MICTPKFTFIHLHKAAGQSINAALLACIPEAKEIGYHFPAKLIPESAAHLPVIGIVRNPWDWYVSWYAFNNLGGVRNPLFSIVSRGKQAGFKETISNLIRYPQASPESDHIRALHQSVLPDVPGQERDAGFTRQCVNEMESETLGYYSALVERMFGTQRPRLTLIPFEDLEKQLFDTLQELEVPEATQVRNFMRDHPQQNTSRRSHYAHYFDDELRRLVLERECRLIEQFGYHFAEDSRAEETIDIDAPRRVSKLAGEHAHFKAIGNPVDVMALKAKLLELPKGAWSESDRQTVFDIHYETQSIQLLGEDMSHTAPEQGRFYPDFAPLLEPILSQLTGHFGSHGTFVRILFAKLLPYSEIRPHVDKGYSLINCNRVHVPIVTNKQVTVFVGGESLHMKEGEMWEINNATVHAVKNDSNEDRIHLIMDWTPTETLLKEKKPFRRDLPLFYRPEHRIEI